MEEFEQMSLTEASFEPYRIKNKIRLIELFGGIGAQAKALEILGADFEHYRLVEWAVNSQYCELIGNERKWYEVRTKLPKGIVEVK